MVIPPGVFPEAVTFGNLTAYPHSGIYGDILNAGFPGADAAQKQALWSSFLWSKGLAIAPGDSSLATELVDYIANYSQYFPKAPTTFPISGPYGSVLQAYYGGKTDEEKEAIWQSFLRSEGLATNPPDSSLAADFVKFIAGTYAASSQQSLSPQEIAKRQLMLQTFNTVLQMLSTIQNTVSVQSANLVFYSKWQQEYTKMLTQTPVYISDPDNTWHVDTTNAAAFTFGYDSISVDDIASYMAQAQTRGDTSVSFSMDTVGHKQFPNSAPSLNNLVYTFTFLNGRPLIQVDSSVTLDISQPPVTNSVQLIAFPPPVIPPGADPTAAYKAGWSSGIIAAITQPPQPYTFDATNGMAYSTPGGSAAFGPLTVPWREREPYPDPAGGSGTVDSAQSQANTNASEKRSEINSQLQQYIENTRSRRKVIQTSAQTAQTNLSATKEGISHQADLLTSIMQTMNSLISSIFR